jgi:hypothetical protein
MRKRNKRLCHGAVCITLPALHAGQRRVVREAARFNVLACGRRWGKSVLGVDRLVESVLYGAPAAYFCPTHKMLAEVWRTVRHRLQPLTERVNMEQHRIELVTRGTLEMWSLEAPDAVRGRRYRRVVIDEAAMVRDLAHAWQMVIRPTLADLRGDAWLLSTPRGRNFFWECFQRGQAADAAQASWAEWKSWRMPTATNPHIAPSEIAAARRELPEMVFRQEFLAEFLDQAGGVFRRVTDAATASTQDAALVGHGYVMGVDFARQNDYSVLTVIDTTTRELVALERFNQIDYQVQLGRLHALAERFSPTVIVAEQNSIGLPLIEQLQRQGLPVSPFVTTSASKARIIEALALAFEQGNLRILDNPILIHELQAFAMERLPSGLIRYSAPPSDHDDTVMSLALAWSACEESSSLLLW